MPIDLTQTAEELEALAIAEGFANLSRTIHSTTTEGNAVAATVTVTITDPGPTLVDDTASTPANTPINIAVLDNDTDPLGRTLQLTSVQSPTGQGGTAVINADGVTIDYTPPNNFLGDDTFTYNAEPV